VSAVQSFTPEEPGPEAVTYFTIIAPCSVLRGLHRENSAVDFLSLPHPGYLVNNFPR
jgi:hypothetical protein